MIGDYFLRSKTTSMITTSNLELHDVLNRIIKICDESKNFIDYNDEMIKLALKEYDIDESYKYFKVCYYVSVIYVIFMKLLETSDEEEIAFNFETKEFNVDEQHHLNIDTKQFILAKHGFHMFIPKNYSKEKAWNAYKNIDGCDVLLRMISSYPFWDTDVKIKNCVKELYDAYVELRIKWLRCKIDKSEYIEFQPDY